MGTEQEKAASSLKEKLEGIKCRWVKRTIKEVDDLEKELYAFKDEHSQNDDYKCLLVHIKNKITTNDLDVEKWTAEMIMTFLTIVLSVFAGALGLQSDGIDFVQGGWVAFVIFLLFVSASCIAFGMHYETRLKKRTKEVNFYEICLNILK